jgi:DNA-binding response OmpR family regulator
LAEPDHPELLVVHPDPTLRDDIVAALSGRGHLVRAAPADPLDPSVPSDAIVIADHTQLPLAARRLLVLVPTREHGAILAAFAAGADDVLAGPLDPSELSSRVAILARTPAQANPISVGPLTIDTLARTVTLAARPLELTRGEYDLLARLATAPGRVFTKADLLLAISPAAPARPPSTGSTRPTRRVDTQVARLRRRLGDHRALLVTVWGVGYRLG